MKIPRRIRDRVMIDKLAKSVAKHGFAFEQEIVEQVRSLSLQDESL